MIFILISGFLFFYFSSKMVTYLFRSLVFCESYSTNCSFFNCGTWKFIRKTFFVHLIIKCINSFFLCVPDIVRTDAAAAAADNNRIESNMSLHPYFDFDVPRNITARVGQTAFLRCHVEQLGDKSVSLFVNYAKIIDSSRTHTVCEIVFS